MRKTSIILFVMLVIMSIVVVAQPPFQETGGTTGLEMRVPIYDYLMQDREFRLHTHVYNISNGLLMNNDTTSCELHLYNSTGSHALEADMLFDSNLEDFYVNIGGSNFSILGDYSYIIGCNTSTVGGHVSYGFRVTNDGLADEKLDTSAGIATVVFLTILIIGLFALPFKVKFSMHEWLDQLLARMCFVISMFLVAFVIAIISTIADAASLGITQELMRFLWLTHKAAWLFMLYSLYKYFMDMLKLWHGYELEKRMGKE